MGATHPPTKVGYDIRTIKAFAFQILTVNTFKKGKGFVKAWHSIPQCLNLGKPKARTMEGLRMNKTTNKEHKRFERVCSFEI